VRRTSLTFLATKLTKQRMKGIITHGRFKHCATAVPVLSPSSPILLTTMMRVSALLPVLVLLMHSNYVSSFSGRSSQNRKPMTPVFSAIDDDDAQSNDEILKSLMEKYLGSNLRLPTDSVSKNRLGDLYEAEELSNILELHAEIYPLTEEKRKDDPEEIIPSIHDLVMQAIGEVELVPELEVVDKPKEEYPWLTDSIREKMKKVVAIASDVDGTLIGSTQTVHPRTKNSVMRAVQASFSPLGNLKYFFLATGKTRWGALNSLGPEIASLLSQCPGVYIQGLYCIVGDEVIFERKLTKASIEAAERLVKKSETSIIAYDGDDLYTTKITKLVTELHEMYGEPMPIEIPSIVGHAPGIHKILICDDDLDKLAQVRTELEALAKLNNATVTQAVPTMLELLPEGCSKALGVQKVCEALGLDAAVGLLSLGDAENDVEMLKMSAVGVCVGNGSKLAKDAADIVLEETSDEGGAGLAIEVLAGV
jgi:Cof subfamily protein (haloacid dehalogenase superfamily)